jgi:class 3 adenylate cyclase/tetratricopeptide (TPR) repeat protein
VLTCANCHSGNPDAARFCHACGSSLLTVVTAESRRLVTVVFCDLQDSTPLASRLDAESFRKVVTRYFEESRTVLERHGGTVEKFIGDAVMAVFGVPTLHEDDALRAVHAAMEMHETLEVLNDELERDWGVRLQNRIGVNSGEVVTGDPIGGQSFVTGEAVILASRLESAAEPGTILLGNDTYRLVRDAVTTEEVRFAELKGLGAVRAHRLVSVIPGAAGHTRRLDSPFVDRERETALLRDAFERMVEGRRCQLVTILGAAGVGKSRLADELLLWAEDRATSYRGRCLAYGEGITFWPIAEVATQAAGLADEDTAEHAREKIADLLPSRDGPVVAKRVSQAIGIGQAEAAAPEETFWAIRMFFEALARRRPLILVLDDIQWGEPTFLELIEHIADWSRDVPMMLLCLARPDFLETNRSWGGGKLNATSLLLEPLRSEDGDVLVRNLLGSAELAPRDRERIVEVAGGNPLFVEEILSMLIDDELLEQVGDRWVPTDDLTNVAIPPTISALLAARLDRLTSDERTVIERAAVIGQGFSIAALTALVPMELATDLDACLTSLVRKELLQPPRSGDPDGGQYRYRHILIRDAAYESLSKQARAELHERFADWFEARATERIEEFEEFIGYHLEQAHRYLGELGPPDERARTLAVRAGSHLASAGRRALARGDMRASANLLRRAAALMPRDSLERGPLLADLAESFYFASDLDHCIAMLDELLPIARTAGDRPLETWAELRKTELGFLTDPRGTTIDVFRTQALDAISTFERLGDTGRLAGALTDLADCCWFTGSADEMLQTSERALLLARNAGDWRTIPLAASYLGRALVLGETPCSDAEDRLRSLIDDLEGERMAQATCRLEVATVLAMLERFDEARGHVAFSRDVFEDLGQRRWLAAVSEVEGLVAWAEGMLDEAERGFRSSYLFFQGQHDTANAVQSATGLSQVLCELGRFDEAGALADEVAKDAGVYDLETQAGWRCVKARVLASRGELEEAEVLARAAVERIRPTEFLDLQADALVHLAEVLHVAGRTSDATEAFGHAIENYRRKEDLAGLRRARERLTSSGLGTG